MSQRDPGVYLEDIEHYAGVAIRFTAALRVAGPARVLIALRASARLSLAT